MNYTIEVNDSELTLIIWGLKADAQRNGGSIGLASAENDGITIADTNNLIAKITAVREKK